MTKMAEIKLIRRPLICHERQVEVKYVKFNERNLEMQRK